MKEKEMTPEEAYRLIDDLMGIPNVNRAVGVKRDEAMKIIAKLIPENGKSD